MSRHDWTEAGGFLSMTALLFGLGVALVIPGMEWAAFAGTVPAIGYCVACHFADWSREI